jgi:hypothetical protein
MAILVSEGVVSSRAHTSNLSEEIHYARGSVDLLGKLEETPPEFPLLLRSREKVHLTSLSSQCRRPANQRNQMV